MPECEYNFCDMARTLRMGENAFPSSCNFRELGVVKKAHITTCALCASWQPLYRIGRTTRIDVLRSATQQLMDTASATQNYSSQFRMAIYDFGASAGSAGLRAFFALSSSLSSAKTAAGNIDLMTVNGQNQNGDQDTNFTNIFPAISSAIGGVGDCRQRRPSRRFRFDVVG